MSSSAQHHFRILTVNIFARPPIPFTFDQKKKRLALLLSFLKEQHARYDFVCIQELFSVLTHRREDLIEALVVEYPYSIKSAHQPLFSLRPIDGGCVLLSKHPFESSGEIPYHRDTLRGPDAATRKGFLWACIRMPTCKRRLLMTTTHTQACYQQEKDAPLIQLQLSQCFDFLRRKAQSQYENDDASAPLLPAIVLAGDLNSPRHVWLPDHAVCTSCLHSDESLHFTFPGTKQVLDYVVAVNSEATLLDSHVLAEHPDLSDHLPVEASLCMNSPPS